MNSAMHRAGFRGALRRMVVVGLGLMVSGPAWAQGTQGTGAEGGATRASSEQAAPPAAASPLPEVVVRASSEGFSLSTADKSFQLRLRGYLHADGRFFSETERRPGANTFQLRRVRPIFEGTLLGAFDFRLMPDFGGGSTSIQDAYVDIRPRRELRLRVGKFKPPVGLERLLSATQLVFVERALPTNLVPNRDLGLQVHGEVLGGVLSYALGAFNGVPDGSSADVNSDNSLELAGRIFTHPFRSTSLRPLQGLGLGFAASRGKRRGTATASGLAPYRSTGQQVFFSYLTGTTAAEAVVASGEQLRLSPQGYYYWGPFGLLVEYVSSSQEVRRGTDSARLRNEAWQAAGSFVLFGGSATPEGVRPTRPFRPEEGTWGAVELAARYSELRVDPEAFPVFADPARSARTAKSWGAAANWYLNTHFRFAAGLDGTTFEAGASDDADRPSETVFFSRFQIAW